MIDRLLRRLAACALLLGAAPSFAASSPDLCAAHGYTVGFFNGIWSGDTEDGALSNLQAVSRLHGSTYRGEPVTYELFYNHTDGAQDLAEVFIQRADDIDASGELSRRWEFFWDVVADGDRSFAQRLRTAVPSASLLVSGLYANLVSKAAAGWGRLLSRPPTAVDSAAHRTRLNALVLEGQKLVLLAHSQGNLFANAAHDHVAARAPRSVATVHVAPASATLRGDHLLADIDLVVNALRVQGLSTVPPVNLALPLSASDPTGHSLVDTYLDAQRAGRARVANRLAGAFDAVAAAPSSAPRGFFTVTLTWDGAGDLDLHAIEPSGAHVFHAQPQGQSGRLDADDRLAGGPEHYVASCDALALVPGSYRIALNYFGGAEGRVATVQISLPSTGEIVSRSVPVGPARGRAGDAAPLPVATVVLTRAAEGGMKASVQ